MSFDTDDAFLVRDINNDGAINDGTELFGQGTTLRNGLKAEHGFEALAELDSVFLGGNGDGIINSVDEGWSSMQLWIDKDANGLSTPAELHSLEDYNIVEFRTTYTVSLDKKDSAGNSLPFWSWAIKSGGEGPNRYQVVDVFFKEIEK